MNTENFAAPFVGSIVVLAGPGSCALQVAYDASSSRAFVCYEQPRQPGMFVAFADIQLRKGNAA
jgi:hypothetical protein